MLSIGTSLSIISLTISLLALSIAILPIIAKILLYHFYQPFSLSIEDGVSNDQIIWDESQQKTEAAPDDGEWDLFDFSLTRKGRITPYVERIKFFSSIPLKPRDYAKETNRVVRTLGHSEEHMFQYEWNPDRLSDPITGERGQEIGSFHHMHLPFKRPDSSFELTIEINYEIPVSESGVWWSSDFIYFKPIRRELELNIPEEE